MTASEYVFVTDGLPELHYPLRPEHCCASCVNNRTTNAGAARPGSACSLAEYLFKRKGIVNGSSRVDDYWGTCRFYGIATESIIALADILFPKKGKGGPA